MEQRDRPALMVDSTKNERFHLNVSKLYKRDGSGFKNILPLHLDAKMPFAFSLLAEQNVTAAVIDGDHSYYNVVTDTISAPGWHVDGAVGASRVEENHGKTMENRWKMDEKSMGIDGNRVKSGISQVLRQIPCCLDTIVYHDYCMPEVYRAIQEFANAGLRRSKPCLKPCENHDIICIYDVFDT